MSSQLKTDRPQPGQFWSSTTKNNIELGHFQKRMIVSVHGSVVIMDSGTTGTPTRSRLRWHLNQDGTAGIYQHRLVKLSAAEEGR